MSVNKYLKKVLPQKLRHWLRERFVSLHVKHLHGPRRVRIADNEAVVTCVVKNGEFYMQQFIEHYTRMGFRHILFLDNGSDDRTIEIAAGHANVSVFQSTLPIVANQGFFKAYLATDAAEGGWRLDADNDEFFDYPFSDSVGLGSLLDYLNKYQYTAVVTQLLDMFSDGLAADLMHRRQEVVREVYQYYDLSNIARADYGSSELVAKYGSGNRVSHPGTQLLFGGIRKTLYGNNCLLTKHSLFRPVRGMELFRHVHFVNNAALADVSCVMKHYKLTSNAFETASRNKQVFSSTSVGYNAFIEFMLNNPDSRIKRDTAQKYKDAVDLAEKGFLYMSDRYRAHMGGAAG